MKQTSVEKIKFWQDVIKRQAESGLSIKDFCLQESLNLHTFKYWKYKRKVEACFEDSNVETNAPSTKQIVLSDSFQCEAVEINSARRQSIKNSFVPIKIVNEESAFVSSSVEFFENPFIPLGERHRLVIPESFNTKTMKKLFELLASL